MKHIILLRRLLITHAVACMYMCAACQTSAQQSKTAETFIGNTACDAYIKQLLNIPSGLHCDKISWRLRVYDSAGTVFFNASCIYGVQQINYPGFEGGGQPLNVAGTVTIEKGMATDTEATVYKLCPYNNQPCLLLVKLDDNILHFLFRDKNLLIGNASWGYALNRVTN